VKCDLALFVSFDVVAIYSVIEDLSDSLQKHHKSALHLWSVLLAVKKATIVSNTHQSQ